MDLAIGIIIIALMAAAWFICFYIIDKIINRTQSKLATLYAILVAVSTLATVLLVLKILQVTQLLPVL